LGIFELLHRRVDDLKSAPGIAQLRRRAYDRRFATARAAHMFRGVFDSFEAAQADAPRTAPAGYDNAASSELYIGPAEVSPHDYPAFFWIAQALQAGARKVVDLGGNIGFKFDAFASLAPLPPDLQWLVIDVPEVARKGRELREAAGAASSRGLAFSSDYADIDGADVLFASGTLQYLPQTLAAYLSALRVRPQQIVINTTPVHATRSFFTLNSIGTAYCPYRVQSRGELTSSLAGLGYTLRASWLNPGKGMTIPFVAGHDVRTYSGYAFELQRP